MSRACDECLARPKLLAMLAGHLDPVRSEISELLELDDAELIAAVGGRRRRELERRLIRFDAEYTRGEARDAGLETICRCDPDYPARLREVAGPPSVLYVAGRRDALLAAAAEESVAIVGARRASAYGTEMAHSLARRLSCAGLPVISGLATGIDAAAHRGALTVNGVAVAVLPGSAARAYPRENVRLHRRLLDAGAAVSELPPVTAVRRWMFPARNRIIAGLASMTLVVEADTRSGALLTAAHAHRLGRPVGAVPGRVTSVQAAGTNGLLKDGAHLVRDPQDVLDVLFEAGTRTAPAAARVELTDELRTLLAAIGEGDDTTAALSRRGVLPERGLAALAALELAGYVRRGAGGRFALIP